MVTRLVYNNKAFKMIGRYSFDFSNNEVTFNDITIDFTGYTLEDIPYKYQEVKIMQSETEEDILDGAILFTGYVDEIDLSDMKLKEEEREMTLTLLSPLKMATKRCVTLIGTNTVETAIQRVLEPLIEDGFVLKETNIEDGQITTNYVLETVENCMNDIGYKRNVFWYIDEQKNIYVNSIDYLFGIPVTKTIDEDVEEKGLIKIQPEISDTDYANVINFKNVRLIYNSVYVDEEDPLYYGKTYPLVNLEKTIKKGDTISFNYPIIIDEEYLNQMIEEENITGMAFCFYIQIKTSDEELEEYYIGNRDIQNEHTENRYETSGAITFSDDSGDEGDIVLQRDSFFSNLITGFKWNVDDTATITDIQSNTALRYTTMRFIYSPEINALKGIISDTGQIEKTIDYNEAWTTLPQLINYARSLMFQNSNEVSQVTLQYDSNPNLKIGNIANINCPSFYIEGNFAVQKIKYTYNNDLDEVWEVTLKKSDLISTYIDLFRPAQVETSEDTVESVIVSEYLEETINETHSISAFDAEVSIF